MKILILGDIVGNLGFKSVKKFTEIYFNKRN